MSGRFTIRIPDTWQSYDLSGEELAAQRAAVLAGIEDPDQRAAVNRAFRDVRVLLDDARRRGAVYAAGTLARHEDGLLLANLAVFVLRPPRTVGLEDLARDVARGSTGTTVQRSVTVVTLPEAGPATRVIGVERVPVSSSHNVEQLVVHTLVPVPGSDQLLLISCASPNLPLAEPLTELFSAITDTFRYPAAAAG